VRLALVAALALVVVAPAAASEQRPAQREVESEVMCPECSTTLDHSRSPIAQRMKAVIARRIAAGDSKSEIKAKLVREFGPAVLAAPPKEGFNLLAWLLPIGGVLAGAVAAAVLAWRWSRWRDADGGTDYADVAASNGRAPIDPDLERRLDHELARYDA
jgi:cytochrome c-type biogenesis protein CcmH